MKPVPYAQVLQQAVELTGRVYDDGSGNVLLLTEEGVTFRSLIGKAVRKAWTEVAWPELCPTEFRRFAQDWVQTATLPGAVRYYPSADAYFVSLTSHNGIAPATESGGVWTATPGYWAKLQDDYEAEEWDASTTYSAGDLVLWEGGVYVLQSSASAGTDPSASNWVPLAPIDRLLPNDAAWEATEMYEVVGVYHDDPRRKKTPRDAAFVQDADGVRVHDQVNGVWVKFFIVPPVFTSDPSEIPGRLADYAALAAAGWQLRMDGKSQAGTELLALANAEITERIGAINWGEGSIGRISIRR